MEIKCVFLNIDTNYLGLTYTCQVEKVVISRMGYALKISGDHLPGKNNNDVNYILFSCIKLDSFPQGLGGAFSQTKKITISECGLKSITRQDLAGFKKLIAFQASYNKLKSIPSDLFNDKPNLKTIDFSFNLIEFVSSRVLEPLLKNDLLLVNFGYNKFISNLLKQKGIHYFFEKSNPRTSLQQLMNIMDTECARPVEEEPETKENFETEHAKKFAMLWTTGRYSDFIIVAADASTEFHVHKLVLQLQSSVFNAIFDVGTDDRRNGKLIIRDFSSGAVREFLRFFYFESIQNKSYATELFSLAGTYKVEKLKSMMEKIILKDINESNAFEILSLGHLHTSNTLKNNAFEVIKKMLHGDQLDEELKEQPKILKKLLEASNTRKRKVKNADEEFYSLLKKYNKKSA